MVQHRWDRREFLQIGGSTLLLLGGAGTRALEARAGAEPGVLVVVFQRGAADALHMVAPYGDKRYRELRGALALEEPGRGENPTLDLGGASHSIPRCRLSTRFIARDGSGSW